MSEDPNQAGEENPQRIVGELRQAQQNVEKLQSQKEILTNSIEELENTMETVDKLENVEEGTEILVPIGAGSYVTAEIKQTDKILCDLGAELTAEKGHSETKKLLEKRKSELEDSLEENEQKIEDLNDRISELRPKAQKMMAQDQQGRKRPGE